MKENEAEIILKTMGYRYGIWKPIKEGCQYETETETKPQWTNINFVQCKACGNPYTFVEQKRQMEE